MEKNKSVVSEVEIYTRLGRMKYASLEPPVKKNMHKVYNITSKDDPDLDAKVCQYIQDITPAILPDSEEFIHREEWDLDTLESSSYENLYHEHHQRFRDFALETHTKSHDILCLFQCSASKPYECNRKWNIYWRNYGGYVDFAFSSVAGVIPKGMGNYYPIRYTNMGTAVTGDVKSDAGKVKANSLLNFQKKFKYKKVILFIPNNESSWMYKDIYERNVDGCQDWMEFVVTDKIRQDDADELYGGNPGLAQSRMWNSLRCKWKLEDLILNNLEGESKIQFQKDVNVIRDKRITACNKSRARKMEIKKQKLQELENQ